MSDIKLTENILVVRYRRLLNFRQLTIIAVLLSILTNSAQPLFFPAPPGFPDGFQPPGFPPSFPSFPPGIPDLPPGFPDWPPGFPDWPPGFPDWPPGFPDWPPGFSDTSPRVTLPRIPTGPTIIWPTAPTLPKWSSSVPPFTPNPGAGFYSFSFPTGCQGSQCQFRVALNADYVTGILTVSIRARQAEGLYTGIGFQQSQQKTYDFIVGAINANGSYCWEAYYGADGNFTKDQSQDVKDFSLIYFNGVLNFEFSRKLDTGDLYFDCPFSLASMIVLPVSGGQWDANFFSPPTATPLSVNISLFQFTPSPPLGSLPRALSRISRRLELNYPTRCSQPACLFHISFDVNYQLMTFSAFITAKQPASRWTGCGFSRTKLLFYQDWIIGLYLNETNSMVIEAFRDIFGEMTWDRSQGITNYSLTYAREQLSFSFSRAIDTGDKMDLAFSEALYIILPIGGGSFSEQSFAPPDQPEYIDINEFSTGQIGKDINVPSSASLRVSFFSGVSLSIFCRYLLMIV